jgi:hypothetical protein
MSGLWLKGPGRIPRGGLKKIMTERTKVVVRHTNGTVLKGYTQDFFPNKDRFHLFPVDKPNGQGIEIILKELKGMFFVRDFAGDPQYTERKKFNGGEKPPGKKIDIMFSDGEVMVGSTLGYDSKRPGFFILPVDPNSNNLRVFVISTAVKQIRLLG